MTFDGNNSHNSSGVQKQNPSLVNICSEGSKQQAADPISPETLHLHLQLWLQRSSTIAMASDWWIEAEKEKRGRGEHGMEDDTDTTGCYVGIANLCRIGTFCTLWLKQ